jgi:hypothetical protein
MENRAKKRRAFRPTLVGSVLEQRVVMASGLDVRSLIAGLAQTSEAAAVSGYLAQLRRDTGADNQAQGLTQRQIRQAFRAEVAAAAQDLETYLDTQAAPLFASGATPTAQQLADFQELAAGAINATAFRLSSEAAILPRSRPLVRQIQRALIGNGQNSLVSRIARATSNPNNTGATEDLQAAINRQISRAVVSRNGVVATLDNFFSTTNLNRAAVDATGRQMGLQAFLGQRIVSQSANTFGTLASAVPGVANTTLFANGAITADPAALNQFSGQLTSAVNTAAFQLGNNLRLFPNALTDLAPQLQSSLFALSTGTEPGTSTGTGTGGISTGAGTGGTTASSLLASLQGLPADVNGFSSSISTAFSSSFSNLVSPLTQFFGLPTTATVALPTSNFTSVFSPSFQSFGNGFNNGFVTSAGTTGFIGFGPASATFNPAFGAGFGGLVSSLNPTFGFQVPATGTSNGALGGTGTGGGVLGGTGAGGFAAPGTSLPGGGTAGGPLGGGTGGTINF